MSYISLINKYKPNSIDDFNIDELSKQLLRVYIKNNIMSFVIQGNSSTGKSSLINVLLNLYYKDKNTINNNTIYINLLKEQGINYYRNELKNFCHINNISNLKVKKTIILDDLDLLNEQCQQIFNTFINTYENINYIISCNDIQKIKSTIINKFELIRINNINSHFLIQILDKILFEENINLNDNCKDFVIKSSNYSIPNMINIIEKVKLIEKNTNINIDSLENITCNILLNDFKTYLSLCSNNKIKEATKFIISICNNGYSVIDILEEFFSFIKNHSNLEDKYKYQIVKIICSYIHIFNNIHEDQIELIFLTNNIIKILGKSV
tara:strand:- start:372 stop:1343 length:972 start_codon:yes stop_codon:yes gene_type:complete